MGWNQATSPSIASIGADAAGAAATAQAAAIAASQPADADLTTLSLHTPGAIGLALLEATTQEQARALVGTSAGASAGQTLYLDPLNASDLSTYYTAAPTPSASAETTLTAALTGTAFALLGAFATDPGVPGVILLPAGQYERDFAVSTGGASQLAEFRTDLYTCHADGSGETLRRSSTSTQFSGTAIQEVMDAYIDPSSYVLALTDRLVIKVYARRVSGPATCNVTLYCDGIDHVSRVHTTIPISVAAISLIETSGPTTLVVGSVADGQALKRTGAAIVGYTPASGGPTSTPVVIAPSQSDPATVTGFAALHPELMTATTDADGVLTLTSIGDIASTHYNDTGPAERRVSNQATIFAMVWRMGLTSALGGTVSGAQGGLWNVATGALLIAWRLCNDGQADGPEAIRVAQDAGYLSGSSVTLGAGAAAAGLWFALEVEGLDVRCWYNPSTATTEPTTGWVCVGTARLAAADGIATWRECFSVLRITSAVSPVGFFATPRTVRQPLLGWAQ